MKMRSRRRTHHSHVAWSGSGEEFQSQTPQPAWDAAWDRVRAERKQAGLPNAYNLTPYRFMNSTNSQSKKGPQRANVGFHEAP